MGFHGGGWRRAMKNRADARYSAYKFITLSIPIRIAHFDAAEHIVKPNINHEAHEGHEDKNEGGCVQRKM
jgi:hypothetical protein